MIRVYRDRIKDLPYDICQLYLKQYMWVYSTDLAYYFWNGSRVLLKEQINPDDPELPALVEGHMC